MNDAMSLAKSFGYLTPAEVYALKMIVCDSKLPDTITVVNIGAGSGTSSLAMAEARPDAHIITIDMREGGPYGGLKNEKNAFDGSELGLRELPTQILGDSVSVGKNWEGDQVDVIFVDGDHKEAGIRGDIESWEPHLATGGIIAFHDYGAPPWPAVAKVVDELIVKRRFVGICRVDTFIAFKKVHG